LDEINRNRAKSSFWPSRPSCKNHALQKATRSLRALKQTLDAAHPFKSCFFKYINPNNLFF
jgi:hypothetical protein